MKRHFLQEKLPSRRLWYTPSALCPKPPPQRRRSGGECRGFLRTTRAGADLRHQPRFCRRRRRSRWTRGRGRCQAVPWGGRALPTFAAISMAATWWSTMMIQRARTVRCLGEAHEHYWRCHGARLRAVLPSVCARPRRSLALAAAADACIGLSLRTTTTRGNCDPLRPTRSTFTPR